MPTTETEGAKAAREDEGPVTRADSTSTENPAPAGHPAATELALEDLGLSKRWLNLLLGAGLESTQDLLDLLAEGESAFLAIPRIGGVALKEVQERLAAHGLLENRYAGEETGREQEGAGVAEHNANPGVGATEQKREAMEDQTANTESASSTQSEKAEELQISFVVRLVVDEQGQPKRTEIEPSKKEIEPGRFKRLDGQELVSYIEEYISSVITPEARPSAAPPPREAARKIPEPVITQPFLTISDVRVLREGVASLTPPPLGAGQAFVVQVRFRIDGPGATSIAAQHPACRIEIYASPMAGTGGQKLFSDTKEMSGDGPEYSLEIPVAGLDAGTHLLHTVIAIFEPTKLLGTHKGTAVRVSGP